MTHFPSTVGLLVVSSYPSLITHLFLICTYHELVYVVHIMKAIMSGRFCWNLFCNVLIIWIKHSYLNVLRRPWGKSTWTYSKLQPNLSFSHNVWCWTDSLHIFSLSVLLNYWHRENELAAWPISSLCISFYPAVLGESSRSCWENRDSRPCQSLPLLPRLWE